MSGSDIYDKARLVLKVWRARRPGKTFFKMSSEDFEKIVTESGDARAALAELEKLMQEALARRDEADKLTRRGVLRVVNAVKGDADEGEDCELLAAMGYLPHTARSSIMSMARKNASRAKAAQAEEESEEEGQD